jgi:hypothetical protein
MGAQYKAMKLSYRGPLELPEPPLRRSGTPGQSRTQSHAESRCGLNFRQTAGARTHLTISQQHCAKQHKTAADGQATIVHPTH